MWYCCGAEFSQARLCKMNTKRSRSVSSLVIKAEEAPFETRGWCPRLNRSFPSDYKTVTNALIRKKHCVSHDAATRLDYTHT